MSEPGRWPIAFPLYILAGGASRRFGTEKALFLLEGKPLLLRAAEQFAPLVCERWVVAGQPEKFTGLGFCPVRDLRPENGPLAGLEAAARHAEGRAEIFALSSCDRLGLRPEWLELLATAMEREKRPAAAFFDDRWQPFPSLYRPEIAEAAARLLDRGELRIRFLLEEHAVRLPVPAGWESVRDFNYFGAR